MKHQAFGQSDPGRVRQYNEDAFLMDASLGLYIVCDGFGGPPVGELACQTACTALQTIVDQNRDMLEAIDQKDADADTGQAIDMINSASYTASRQVFKTLQAKGVGKGGCAMALLLLAGRYAVIAHAGDCRVYLMRDDQIHRITDDHARTDDRKDGKGERKILTRALGVQEDIEAESLVMEVMPGDIFLLATDGLYEYFPDPDLADCCRKFETGQIPHTLIRAANERGGKDNATALVARVESVRVTEVDPGEQVKILKRIPLFMDLDYRELVQLGEVTRFRKYEDGDPIVKDGYEGSDLLILLKGKAKVVKLEQALAELTPGSFFGEGGLIEPGTRNADVVAKGKTTVMTIRRTDLFRLLDADAIMCTKVLWAMCRMLNRRLRHTSDELSWIKSLQ